MPSFQEFYFESCNGKNSIRVLKCVPEQKPRAVMQIAHGIAEHMDRYRPFMEFMAQHGIVAAGNDHLGHGKSFSTEEERGFFAAEDGWNHVVRDMDKLHELLKEQYPDIPFIHFGHSMGSFLTRTYMADYPGKYNLAVISGTGQLNPLIVKGGLALAELMVKMDGPTANGQKLNDIAFGSYLDRIKSPRTPYDWISTDDGEVTKYAKDPLCGFVCKLGLYRDMMRGLNYIIKKSTMEKMDKTKPVYFMSGKEDPVGDYGAGVERAYKAFCDAGLHDVYLRLYPDARHELLNSPMRQQVMDELMKWIDEKLG